MGKRDRGEGELVGTSFTPTHSLCRFYFCFMLFFPHMFKKKKKTYPQKSNEPDFFVIIFWLIYPFFPWLGFSPRWWAIFSPIPFSPLVVSLRPPPLLFSDLMGPFLLGLCKRFFERREAWCSWAFGRGFHVFELENKKAFSTDREHTHTYATLPSFFFVSWWKSLYSTSTGNSTTILFPLFNPSFEFK